ncbi:hypothetical protein D3C77_610450 [compost metagenome]
MNILKFANDVLDFIALQMTDEVPYSSPSERLPFRYRTLWAILADMNDAFIQKHACRLQTHIFCHRDDINFVPLASASFTSRLNKALHLLYPFFE